MTTDEKDQGEKYLRDHIDSKDVGFGRDGKKPIAFARLMATVEAALCAVCVA